MPPRKPPSKESKTLKPVGKPKSTNPKIYRRDVALTNLNASKTRSIQELKRLVYNRVRLLSAEELSRIVDEARQRQRLEEELLLAELELTSSIDERRKIQDRLFYNNQDLATITSSVSKQLDPRTQRLEQRPDVKPELRQEQRLGFFAQQSQTFAQMLQTRPELAMDLGVAKPDLLLPKLRGLSEPARENVANFIETLSRDLGAVKPVKGKRVLSVDKNAPGANEMVEILSRISKNSVGARIAPIDVHESAGHYAIELMPNGTRTLDALAKKLKRTKKQ